MTDYPHSAPSNGGNDAKNGERGERDCEKFVVDGNHHNIELLQQSRRLHSIP
jgi:hypothetical protein